LWWLWFNKKLWKFWGFNLEILNGEIWRQTWLLDIKARLTWLLYPISFWWETRLLDIEFLLLWEIYWEFLRWFYLLKLFNRLLLLLLLLIDWVTKNVLVKVSLLRFTTKLLTLTSLPLLILFLSLLIKLNFRQKRKMLNILKKLMLQQLSCWYSIQRFKVQHFAQHIPRLRWNILWRGILLNPLKYGLQSKHRIRIER